MSPYAVSPYRTQPPYEPARERNPFVTPSWGDLRYAVLSPIPVFPKVVITANQTLDQYVQNIVEGRRKG